MSSPNFIVQTAYLLEMHRKWIFETKPNTNIIQLIYLCMLCRMQHVCAGLQDVRFQLRSFSSEKTESLLLLLLLASFDSHEHSWESKEAVLLKAVATVKVRRISHGPCTVSCI